MTGKRLAELMADPETRQMVSRAARRYTKCVEDQEEYIDDAWMRIAQCNDDASAGFLEKQASRGVRAAYDRKRYQNVGKKTPENPNGIGENQLKSYRRGDLQPLGRGRYLVLKPEKLSGWYYHKEWEEYGLPKEGMQVFTFYKIVVSS